MARAIVLEKKTSEVCEIKITYHAYVLWPSQAEREGNLTQIAVTRAHPHVYSRSR